MLRYDVDSTFPGVVMELTENEVREYYTPRDFMVGKTVTIYNRRFFIYEMDNFTKAFYWKNFGVNDFNSVDVEQKDPPLAKMVRATTLKIALTCDVMALMGIPLLIVGNPSV